jgi:DNA ligase-1
MHRFTALFTALDRTKRTGEKLEALVRYFREAPHEDAAWAMFFLSGRTLKRLLPRAVLGEAVEEITGLPRWLISASHEAVGDFPETIALLLPSASDAESVIPALHIMVRDRLEALRDRSPADQKRLLLETWSMLDREAIMVWNKLIMGSFRVGVSQTLLTKALAAVANVPPAIMAHRLAGAWTPTAESFARIIAAESEFDTSQQPYPFLLGHPLQDPIETLGDRRDWQIEWKYDGIRAQVIRRNQQVVIWSRGEELITPAYPEIVDTASALPDGTVLDGEIVAWEADHPLPFTLLQRRLNRKLMEPRLFIDVPVTFIAFDMLEQAGADMREVSLLERRGVLEATLSHLPRGAAIKSAPILDAASWDDVALLRRQSRQRHVEGVMLKRLDGGYGVGRRAGDWWKWKIDPHTVDAVLIYAQGGSGRRAGVFTDYTFGVWDNGELVPVAKAYSGLTDAEIRKVDSFIRRNTIERHGPVRVVKPELVFELAFEAIQPSERHRAGLALRFPRMARWRTDKSPHDADSLDSLRDLMQRGHRG